MNFIYESAFFSFKELNKTIKSPFDFKMSLNAKQIECICKKKKCYQLMSKKWQLENGNGQHRRKSRVRQWQRARQAHRGALKPTKREIFVPWGNVLLSTHSPSSSPCRPHYSKFKHTPIKTLICKTPVCFFWKGVGLKRQN